MNGDQTFEPAFAVGDHVRFMPNGRTVYFEGDVEHVDSLELVYRVRTADHRRWHVAENKLEAVED